MAGVPGVFPVTDVVPYPPSPLNVPRNLTTPTTGYRLRVFVVLTSLFLFALLSLGLVAGSGYLCYWSFASLAPPRPINPAGQRLLSDASRTDQRLTRLFQDA